MFQEVPSKLKLPEIEEKIIRFWNDRQIFKKSLEKTKDREPFVFYEGPPTANGKPGIHHVMSRTVKDVVCRHRTMKGYFVNRKAGWDTHGLPVEIEVEKELQIKDKDEIEAYGVQEFNNMCRKSVFAYKSDWDHLTERIGYWLDLENPYITFENDYIESIWWILSELWKKELLYKGFKILPYCPRCETPLSSHEVSQGYKEVKDPSIYVRVPLADEIDSYLLVWTTTPWTLISNVAMAVHPEVEYVRLEHKGEQYIMAEARVQDLFDADSYKILNRFPGKALEGKRYQRLFDYAEVEVDKDAFFIAQAEFVTTDDGTGIVHIAPAFGEDDNQLGKRYNLPVLRPVDHTGSFSDEITDYAGMFVKSADEHIIAALKGRGLLVKKTKIEHSYPHCWRCDSPLLYYARESWYIKTSQFKEALLKNNAQINWHPKEVGEGRFGEWLKNNVDWSLSRDRYWGTPLNIWICERCGHQTAVDSVKTLFERAANLSEKDRKELDLHKPYVDRIELKCESCGGVMYRVPEVIDCWFDSGSMPVAQWHYPFENRQTFEQNFPADFICEGIDQTRGWFYSLLAISTLLFDKPAFKNIVVNELILDKHGQKMSKSKGNVVVPEEIIPKYGADAIRWYLMTVSPPWLPKKFDPEGIREIQRKFFNTLINTYSFFVLYANIDQFSPDSTPVALKERTEIDRWVLSRLYTVIKQVDDYFKRYELTKAGRAVADFVIDDVSNWYVRRNRRRFWKSGDSNDKLAAYQTLYEILMNVVKLIAPFTPFISEEIFQNLRNEGDPESVHLCDYPELTDEKNALIDRDLEDKMYLAQKLVTNARALRNEAQIKVRQPLSEMVFVTRSKKEQRFINEMSEIIRDELNIKSIRLEQNADAVVDLKTKPNFKTLGPRAGKMMGRLNEAIQNFDKEQIESFLNNGYEHVSIDGHEFRLESDDVFVESESREGYVSHSDRDMTLALKIDLDAALVEEGYAREFVNRVQNMRKEAGFEVTDHIIIQVDGIRDEAKHYLQNQKIYICNETLADDLLFDAIHADFQRETQIDNDTFTIGLDKQR